MEICERVFELLGESKSQQRKLSQATGISEQTISSWKKRGTDPSAKHIYAIAEFLNISPVYLLTGKEEPKIEINQDEQELLKIYRCLDRKRKIRVNSFIYDELENMEQDGDMPKAQGFTKNN